MLIKATENDRNDILSYCSDEPSINLFIIGDIELYGFDSTFQEVWIQKDDTNINGIVLRYHDNFILYSKTKLNFNEVIELFKSYNVGVISGKSSVVNDLYPLVENNYSKREMNFAELTSDKQLKKDIVDITIATPDNAREIALSYESIKEFEHLYAGGLEGRYTQILKRIESKEGIHMFMKKNNQIIAHGNTAAETSTAGMVGGVMTIEEFRRNGNAKTIVSALCQNLLNRGKKACLFYNGQASEELFKNLGFQDIDKWIILGGKNNE